MSAVAADVSAIPLPPVQYLTPEVEAREKAKAASWRLGRRVQRMDQAIRDYQYNHCNHGAHTSGCSRCAAAFILGGEAAATLEKIGAELATPWCPEIGSRWVIPIGTKATQKVEQIKAALSRGEVSFRARTTTPAPGSLLDVGAPVFEPPLFDGLLMGSTEGRTRVRLIAVGFSDHPRLDLSLHDLLTHGRLA